MPIRVPDELPAVNFLREENVFVMTTSRASGQEIRPLKVLILNIFKVTVEVVQMLCGRVARFTGIDAQQLNIDLQR